MELTDIDKQFVTEFANHREMFEAVKKALSLATLDNEAVNPRLLEYGQKLLNLSNEELGAKLRARVIALEALEVGFGKLLTYRTPPPTPSNINKAR